MNFNISTFLTRYKKPLIFTAIILLIIIIITSIIVHLANKSWLPLTNENLISEIPYQERNDFKKSLELQLSYFNHSNVSDATIRDGSASIRERRFETTPGLSIYTATFLVDIDSINQTYSASVSWYSKPQSYVGDNISIACAKISESKYPEAECESYLASSHDTALHLPYEFTLDNKKVIVKDITNERNGKTLQIYLYSCNDDNPPLEATEQRVRDWVKNTVKDPLADKYFYHVRYGYCKDDIIPN